MVGDRLLARRDVHGAQRPRHGGDRLHRGPDPERLAGGHAALGATGATRRASEPVAGRHDLVVGERAGCGREREAVADLDTLDRLDPHQRAGQPRVEAAVPVHVRAEPRRQAVHDHLDDAARACRRPCAPGRSGPPSPRRPRGRGSAPGPRRAGPGPPAGVRRPRVPRRRRARRRGRPPARPTACSRKFVATRPSATRAAVSRAEARSSTGRASSKAYFCMPTRSACPGRGRVRAALRARASRTTGSTGSADITCSHLGHSVLPMVRATGPPWVCPCRTPPVRVTSSASNFIRAPRP